MALTSASSYSDLYKSTLLDDVIPFWTAHSIDREFGGFLTCLDRAGNVYDSDKFMWLQARQIWAFSMLYNQVDSNPGWLDIARHGVDFIIKYGRDDDGSFYFSTTRSGKPLTHAFNIFSDCFAALALHEFAQASQDGEVHDLALATYHRYLSRIECPKGRFTKQTDQRPIRSFGLPMMTAYLTGRMQESIPQDAYHDILTKAVDEILGCFDSDIGAIREHVGRDGEFLDTFDGRLINPGHGIEAMWFLMDIAVAQNDEELLSTAIDICLSILEYSWDSEHGGIFYFLDAKGAPPQQLEWDQKLWWVHQEALIALSRAYAMSRREDVGIWYERLHTYAWSHFPDPDFGEWYGYLKRDGQPLFSSKGGKWKGCFHTPRAMFECWKNFDRISSTDAQG